MIGYTPHGNGVGVRAPGVLGHETVFRDCFGDLFCGDGMQQYPVAVKFSHGPDGYGFRSAGDRGGDGRHFDASAAGRVIHFALRHFTGPTHIVDAKRAKDTLIHSTGSKDWYVVHVPRRAIFISAITRRLRTGRSLRNIRGRKRTGPKCHRW